MATSVHGTLADRLLAVAGTDLETLQTMLDGGELNRLLKWAKAGGRQHDSQETERRTANEERARKNREIFRHTRLEANGKSGSSFSSFGNDGRDDISSLLHMIARWIG